MLHSVLQSDEAAVHPSVLRSHIEQRSKLHFGQERQGAQLLEDKRISQCRVRTVKD